MTPHRRPPPHPIDCERPCCRQPPGPADRVGGRGLLAAIAVVAAAWAIIAAMVAAIYVLRR